MKELEAIKKYEMLCIEKNNSFVTSDEKLCSYSQTSKTLSLLAIFISFFVSLVFSISGREEFAIPFYFLFSFFFSIEVCYLLFIKFNETKKINISAAKEYYLISFIVSILLLFVFSGLLIAFSKVISGLTGFSFTGLIYANSTVCILMLMLFEIKDHHDILNNFDKSNKEKRTKIEKEIKSYSEFFEARFPTLEDIYQQYLLSKKHRFKNTESYLKTVLKQKLRKAGYSNIEEFQLNLLNNNVENINQRNQYMQNI